MAIVSVVATVLSFIAVILLNNTLKETREAVGAADDAVKVTREIGEAQARAYITIAQASITFFKNNFDLHISFENSGRSPSLNLDVFCKLGFHDSNLKVSEEPIGEVIERSSLSIAPRGFHRSNFLGLSNPDFIRDRGK